MTIDDWSDAGCESASQFDQKNRKMRFEMLATTVPLYSLAIVSGLFILAICLLIVVGILIYKARERDYERTVTDLRENNGLTHLQLSKDLETARDQYAGLLDRLYYKKNLPPSEADLGAEYDERRQEQKAKQVERRNGGPISLVPPSSIGPIDSAQLEMEVSARKARDEAAVIASSA